MRLFLTKLLFKLITPLYKDTPVNQDNIQRWLWSSYTQTCFNDYVHTRDLAILQELGAGVDREKYLSLIGQRVELGRFLFDARDAWDKEEKKRKKKITK